MTCATISVENKIVNLDVESNSCTSLDVNHIQNVLSLSSVGIQGVQGDQGIQGEQGIQGIQGEVGASVDLGWAFYRDNQYTELSPLISNDEIIYLTNNGLGATTEKSYLPDTGELWDATNNKIIASGVGDAFVMRIDFKAKAQKNFSYFSIGIDIGDGSPIVIVEKTLSMVKGINVEETFSETFLGFSLNTFDANGGKVFIDTVADSANISIYDIGINIAKVYPHG